NTVINGTSSADGITNTGSSVTINAAAGNDTILLNGSNELVQYKAGDGHDAVYGFSSSDTIRITDGSTYSTTKSGSDVLVSIGAGSLRLKDVGSTKVNISGGNYKAVGVTLSNGIASTLLTGTEVNDSITNSARSVTINTAAGNDVISNTGTDVSLNAGAGDDRINFSGSGTIRAGAGSDDITLSADRSVLEYAAGDGNDYVVGYSSTDTVRIIGNASYSTTAGNRDVTINIGEGKIVLENAANKSLNISGGTLIDTTPPDTTPADTTPSGNDNMFFNRNPNSLVSGSSGSDYIVNGGANSTINAGRGNDTIELSAGNEVIRYANGDGNDTISGVTANTRFNISGASYSTMRSNSNTIIKVGNGQMLLRNYSGELNIVGTLEGGSTVAPVSNTINNTINNTIISGSDNADTVINAAGNVSINVGAGNDYVSNYGSYVTVEGGAGNDTFVGDYSRSMLNGGADNDLISLSAYWNNTIDGDAGNDTIKTDGSELSINGGFGDDVISISGSAVTVRGGKGNDLIRSVGSGGNLYQYLTDDGHDTIVGYNNNDTITVAGSYQVVTLPGSNDVSVYFTGGSIDLKNAKGKTLNINPNSTPTVPADDGNTPQNVIINFMGSLDTSTAETAALMLDEAISVASGGRYTNVDAVIDDLIADCASYNSTDPANGWKKFLSDKCDINLDNNDTGAISGLDAGGSSVEKTATSIICSDTTLNSNFTDSDFPMGGLNVCLATRPTTNSVRPISSNDLNREQQTIFQGLSSGWLENPLDLIANSFGSNYSFDSNSSSTLPKNDNKLYVTFFNEPTKEFANVNPGRIDGEGKTRGPLTLNINMHNYSKFKSGKVDDSYVSGDDSYIGNSYYFERVLAHELVHAVMDVNINHATGDDGLPQFVKDGLAELVHGCDDERAPQLETYSRNPNTLRESLNTSVKSGSKTAYAGGYIFFRYIAKQFSSRADEQGSLPTDSFVSNPDGVEILDRLVSVTSAFEGSSVALSGTDRNVLDASGLTRDVALLGSTTNDSLKAGAGDDQLYGGDGSDTLLGGNGSDTLFGDVGNDWLNGGAGDDILYGGAGSDTLTGGDGADVFVYESGRDVITDYASGVDKIELARGNIKSTSLSGNDLIFHVGSGSLSVAGGKGKSITVIDREGNETTRVYVNETFIEEPDEITSDNW
ncbi:MAG: hypothetical protein IJU71_10005, partial [Selenomonadaceae bacterium]|nr:hypothetical protein [Selenomonadaceae bacterium]